MTTLQTTSLLIIAVFGAASTGAMCGVYVGIKMASIVAAWQFQQEIRAAEKLGEQRDRDRVSSTQ